MAERQWVLDASNGELLVRTGVTGRAARLGHRITIVMTRWHAKVREGPHGPSALHLIVDVGGLQVRHGEGGVKGLSALEKAMVRQSALRTLAASRYPQITYRGRTITPTDGGYDVAGFLTIHGATVAHPVHVGVTEDDAGTHYACRQTLRQTDFDVKPYSRLMGSLQVADEVSLSFRGTRVLTG